MDVKKMQIGGSTHAEKLALYDLDGNGTLSELEKTMMKYDTTAPFGSFSIAEVKSIVNDLKQTEKAKKALMRVVIGLAVFVAVILGVNMALTFVIVDLAKETEASPDGVLKVKGSEQPASLKTAVETTEVDSGVRFLESAFHGDGFMKDTKKISWTQGNVMTSFEISGHEILHTQLPESTLTYWTMALHTTSSACPIILLAGTLNEEGNLDSEESFIMHKARMLPDTLVDSLMAIHTNPEMMEAAFEQTGLGDQSSGRSLLGVEHRLLLLANFCYYYPCPPTAPTPPTLSWTEKAELERSKYTCKGYWFGSCAPGTSCGCDGPCTCRPDPGTPAFMAQSSGFNNVGDWASDQLAKVSWKIG